MIFSIFTFLNLYALSFPLLFCLEFRPKFRSCFSIFTSLICMIREILRNSVFF